MSALPPIADIRRLGCDVRFVPIGDITAASFNHLVGAGERRQRMVRFIALNLAGWITGRFSGFSPFRCCTNPNIAGELPADLPRSYAGLGDPTFGFLTLGALEIHGLQ